LANLDLVLNETGQKVKFLRTDGDGIFRESKNFLDLQKKYGFRHERPGPYDHKHSAHIDRECRTLLDGTRTLLFESGLPSSFWGEASNHFTFVKNQIPIHRVERNGKKVFISPFEKLFGQPGMPLRYLMPFGTAVSVFLPKETRRGPKTPSQQKAYEGVLIGFAEGMKGYRVLDSDNRIHEESFNFCSFSENVFPGHLDGVAKRCLRNTKFLPSKRRLLELRRVAEV